MNLQSATTYKNIIKFLNDGYTNTSSFLHNVEVLQLQLSLEKIKIKKEKEMSN